MTGSFGLTHEIANPRQLTIDKSARGAAHLMNVGLRVAC